MVYIIIKDIADIYENIDFLRNSNYKKIYVYNRENIEETFNTFSKLGIDLYDVVSIYEIEKYMNSFLCDDCLGIKDGKILKLKK